MKKFFHMKHVTAVLFICILFLFSALNFQTSFPILAETVKKEPLTFQKLNNMVDSINSVVNKDVYLKYPLIDGYGFSQKLMGKNEENNFEVVRDTGGNLHYTYFATGPNPVDTLAQRVTRLRDGLPSGTRLLCLMPPDKYLRGYTQFPTGIPYSYANETADNYLKAVQENKIDTLDFRKNLLQSGIPADKLFFKTDHHWTVQTAFWAFGELVGQLNERYGLSLDPKHYYTDISNYNAITYKDAYLGSMGRKTGMLYGGVDDFTLIYPKFKTDYAFHSKNSMQEINTQGRFEDALIIGHPFNIPDPAYSLEADKYFAYLFGNLSLVHITNKQNPQGPKVLFIKDSLSVPLAAFLSTVCSEVWLVDPRYYTDDIQQFVNRQTLDFVFVSIYPQNLTEEFFPYCKK